MSTAAKSNIDIAPCSKHHVSYQTGCSCQWRWQQQTAGAEDHAAPKTRNRPYQEPPLQ